MDWVDYLFSFRGRINRAKLWLFILINIIAFLVIALIAVVVYGLSGGGSTGMEERSAGVAFLVFILLRAIVGIVLFIASLALQVKRLHDRGKSGAWLVLFYLLPIVLFIIGFACIAGGVGMGQNSAFAGMGTLGALFLIAAGGISIWWFIELYCLRGTVGDNLYGPDPLAGKV